MQMTSRLMVLSMLHQWMAFGPALGAYPAAQYRSLNLRACDVSCPER